MPRPASRVELSRIFGVTRAAITKQCKGKWAAACDGSRVDLDHPLIVAAALKKGVDLGVPARAPTPTAKERGAGGSAPTKADVSGEIPPPEPTKRRPGAEKKPDLPTQPDDAGSESDLDFIARTLDPLMPRFGTGQGLKDWASGRNIVETVRGKMQVREIARGRLVPREFIEMHVLSLIEGTQQRLLTDTARSLTRDLYARARSGAPLEEAEKSVRLIIGKQLDGLKTKAAALIRNAGTGRDNAERSGMAGEPGRESDDRDRGA